MGYNGQQQRRRYRLNKRKLAGALLTLGLTAGFVIIAAVSLAKAGRVAAGMEVSTLPQADATPPKSSGQVTESLATGEALEGCVVVIDAGHGGFDPGAIGSGGVREDELNLAIALKLKAELESRGADVLMTREDENALAENKNDDMAERRQIIEESDSDIVISIHMNDYAEDPDVSGPLALFMPGSEQGKALSEAVQQSLNQSLNADGLARAEDLYILRSGNQPCVLVECGYLSNEEEKHLLQQPEYQQKIAEAICDGAEAFIAGD